MYREQPARIISSQANTDVREELRATYNFKGTLVEVAPDGSSVSVNVTDGNGRGREVAEAYALRHPNEPMVFLTQETRVEIHDAPASLSELAAGDEVHVQSKASRDATTFVARKISVENEED